MFSQFFIISAKWWSHPGCQAVATFNKAWKGIANPVNVTMNIFTFVMVAHFFLFPRHPIHFPSIYPAQSTAYYVVSLGYVVYVQYGCLLLANFIKTIFQMYSAVVIFVLPLLRQELRLRTRSVRKYRCLPEMRKNLENIAVTYRSLQIIMKETSLVFGHYLPPLQGVGVQTAIFTGYVLIGHDKDRKNSLDNVTTLMLLAVVPFAIVSWAALLICAARVHKAAKDCVNSWKRDGALFTRVEDRKYFAKFRKSCTPLYFGFPGVMTVRHGTVLKFIQAIVRGTCRALLTLKRK